MEDNNVINTVVTSGSNSVKDNRKGVLIVSLILSLFLIIVGIVMLTNDNDKDDDPYDNYYSLTLNENKTVDCSKNSELKFTYTPNSSGTYRFMFDDARMGKIYDEDGYDVSYSYDYTSSSYDNSYYVYLTYGEEYTFVIKSGNVKSVSVKLQKS